jgi:hypothetical protein
MSCALPMVYVFLTLSDKGRLHKETRANPALVLTWNLKAFN